MTQSQAYNYKSISLVMLKIDLAQVHTGKSNVRHNIPNIIIHKYPYCPTLQELSRMSFICEKRY